MAPPTTPRERRKRKSNASESSAAVTPHAYVALHKSRLADWRPSPISHLAASRDGSLGVAVREDGDVEFYDLNGPHLIHCIPGEAASALTCSAIVETGEARQDPRVFVSGFSGMISEVDGASALPLATDDSYGGAVWALAPAPPRPAAEGLARLAAACEDGAVRLFSVTPGVPGAAYDRAFPAAAGRVVALAWHPSGASLAAAGVDGAVHLREAATGRELLRISLRTAGAAADLVIWALLFLPDGTLVVGDSSGQVSFWEGTHGTRLASFTQHSADVLALAASPTGDRVWAAGVDPALALFARGADGRWAFLSAKRPHSHDVRALALAAGPGQAREGGILLSGGNDAVLLAHSAPRFLKQHPAPVQHAPQRPAVATSPAAAPGAAAVAATPPAAALAVCALRGDLDLWALPRAAPDADPGLAPGPERLASISTPAGRHVRAAALSSDGALLAFSDAQRTVCLRVGSAAPGPEAAAPRAGFAPIPLPAALPAAHLLAFVPGTATLASVSLDGSLHLVDLASTPSAVRAVRAVHDLRHRPWSMRERQLSAARALEPVAQHLVASPDGRFLALTFRRRIQLINVARGELVAPAPVSSGEAGAPIVGLAFSCDSSTLLSLTLSGEVCMHSVPGGEVVPGEEHGRKALKAALQQLGGGLQGVSAHPTLPSVFLLHSSTGVCVLDPRKPPTPEPKRWRRAPGPPPPRPPGSNHRLLQSSDILLDLIFVSPSDLLVVEQSWSEARRSMPAPLHRHRYGS
ncbi:Cirhin [Auxenochlorella protothecoides]|uniref:Cirhin n=1 Tax=Auxenochlorella protothecoides TaxID=3075 RepID=A0A087SG44_AUXPR|nr:Cirhin [Auxenochlorella protothecoides]KFM24698.1 Cirhin [Auxenochlorella protothecoides]